MAPPVVDFGLTRDRLVQLRRRWPCPNARWAALILHGIAEHSGRYDHVGQFLSARGVDVVAIDQRGFGESGGRRGYVASFDEFLDDVEDQLREMAALGRPLVLIGHSMGGLVALSFALERAPKPARLVLSGPALGAKLPAALRAVTPVFARLAPRLQLPSPVTGDQLATDPRVGEAYFADPLVLRHATPALGAALLGQMRRANEMLATLSVPTLVLHGEDDPLVPAEFSLPLADLTSVTRRTYPGLRHEIFNEPSRDEILSEVVDWLG